MRVALPFLLGSSLFASGCAGWIDHLFAPEGADVKVQGLGEAPASLSALLPHCAYTPTDADQSMYASDLPLETLVKGNIKNAQFLHAQLLWEPMPGSTPIAPSATNVALRYVVVSDGKLGVYGGAGFAWPRGKPGEDSLSLVIQGSSLALIANTEGFVDPLTPAQLTGTMVAPPNPQATRRYRYAISQLVTDALGRSRWVRHNHGKTEIISAEEAFALVFPDQAGADVRAR